jgi:DNA polymerase-3 subunit delta
MDALTFADGEGQLAPVYAVVGDDRFLRRLVRERLESLILEGEPADELNRAVYTGEAAEWGAVRQDLETRPFTSPRRLVIVEEADRFVSLHRSKLEAYFARPSTVGVLVLEVSSWPSNTKLARLLPSDVTVWCKTPRESEIAPWLVRRCQQLYQQKLEVPAARLLVELIGPELGILAQEVAKLAVYVGQGQPITSTAVDRLVGRQRVQTVWRILDAAAAGLSGAALTNLRELLEAGEDPHALLGAIAWQVRKMVQVARLREQNLGWGDAMSRVGLPPFKRDSIAQHLQRLGQRVDHLLTWLQEVDLSLKSTDALPAPLLLERLVLRLC